jgi:hypothetical protein
LPDEGDFVGRHAVRELIAFWIDLIGMFICNRTVFLDSQRAVLRRAVT